MKIRKKWISTLLVLALVMSPLPGSLFAAEMAMADNSPCHHMQDEGAGVGHQHDMSMGMQCDHGSDCNDCGNCMGSVSVTLLSSIDFQSPRIHESLISPVFDTFINIQPDPLFRPPRNIL
jgi:hypothetical protein